jgi:hypothetical protein
MIRQVLWAILILALAACSSGRKIGSVNVKDSITELRFLDEYTLPGGMELNGSIIGGLSGIDYDSNLDLYYMISDDPSSKGPARYYTARIKVGSSGIDSVEIIGMTALTNATGNTYSNITKDRFHSADVEAMRFDSSRDELIWSSEGQRYIRDGKKELQDPQIIIMGKDGRYRDSFSLPSNMHISETEKGPRHNSVFEGISFDENFQHVFISVEEPIYEDGPRAGGEDSTAWIRILKFNRKLKQAVGQYAYKVDAVPHPADPPSAFKINGVSDILYLGNEKLLVVERGYSVGRKPSDIRIFMVDLSSAEDITDRSLIKTPVTNPATKKLLIDLNKDGRYIDNVEGITFGPNLPNGHRTILMVTDDNFDKKQVMQFLLYEVIP